jgi:Holliday junction resolvase RusA-like endonuclease
MGRIPRPYMTNEGKRLKEQYQWEARAQWKGKPLAGDIEVSITLYFGTKRAADWDNFHKLSCDALSGYEDDKQSDGQTMAYDKARPRIEIKRHPSQRLHVPMESYVELLSRYFHLGFKLALHALDGPVGQHQGPVLSLLEQVVNVQPKWAHNRHVVDAGQREIPKRYLKRIVEIVGVHSLTPPQERNVRRDTSFQTQGPFRRGDYSYSWPAPVTMFLGGGFSPGFGLVSLPL